MSIKAMNYVWDGCFPHGGSELIVMLAMADWCDDQGGNLYPSIRTVARKIRSSECQARRIIHGLIQDEWIEVVGNHNGGAKGQTRQYRLNLTKLALTPSIDATPITHATPSMDARDGSHGCALPLAPVRAKPSLTIKEPSAPSTSKETAEILAYLNEKTGRSYRPVKANISLIAARLKEGATPDECRAVIDAKVKEWGANPKMAEYLRPATLFNATNYAQYAGALGTIQPDDGRDWE